MSAKILIIEDDLDLTDLIKFRLEQAGYQVISSDNAEEGLKKAQEEQPQLVLLDNVMPGTKGSDIIKKIKRGDELSKIPIVMISGKGEMFYSRKKDQFEWQPNNPLALERGSLPEGKSAESLAAAFGVDDYISKPFEGDLLIEVVKSVLSGAKPKTPPPEEEDDEIIFD